MVDLQKKEGEIKGQVPEESEHQSKDEDLTYEEGDSDSKESICYDEEWARAEILRMIRNGTCNNDLLTTPDGGTKVPPYGDGDDFLQYDFIPF